MLIKKWMTKQVITIDPDASMQDAIYLIKENKISLLPVVENEKLIGIVSDRDLKKASPSDATSLDIHELLYLISKIKVKDLMIKNPYTVLSDFTLEEAAAILLEKNISGLPVVNEKQNLVGIITKNDIFKALISITAYGKKGIQIALCLKDTPGPIKEVRSIISKYNGITASIMSSNEQSPEGCLNVYFRIYQMDRRRLPELIHDLKTQGTILYIVDHKENKRVIYELI